MKLSLSRFHPLLVSLAFLLAAVSLQTAPARGETITIDRVAAIVDDDVIMESELNAQLAAIAMRMSAQGVQLPPEDILKAQVLEHLVVQQLQMQMARRARVEVDEEEINATIAQMRAANGLSHEDFLAELAREGLSIEELQESIRREILISRVQRGVLNNRINVSEHDVDSFLASKEGQFWNAPDYHIGHILIPVSSNADPDAIESAQERAEDIHKRIMAGEDFAQLATLYSSDQYALQGGDWGWRSPTELPELFAEELADMKVGQVSEPFRSGAGFHLLLVKDQRGNEQALVEQTHARHILLRPTAILSDDQARQRLLELRSQANKSAAEFAELAKANSDDIGSRMSGGDLGWSLPGQFVPEFERVMNETAVGEISEPFRSQHGWHILMVIDRRVQDMSEQVKRNQAYNLLRNRRFEEELPIWLQEIRDEAYVEVKLANIALER